MTGLLNLNEILQSLEPVVLPDEYVYCTVPSDRSIDWLQSNPLALIREAEGMTLILTMQSAKALSLKHIGPYRCISLTVHSSLEAVGLTAAVSAALASHQIPANMLAGYFHDHILVPAETVNSALEIIRGLGG